MNASYLPKYLGGKLWHHNHVNTCGRWPRMGHVRSCSLASCASGDFPKVVCSNPSKLGGCLQPLLRLPPIQIARVRFSKPIIAAMWLLENENLFNGRKVWLKPGSRQLIGRTRPENYTAGLSGSIDNKFVSRKHLVISVTEVAPEDGVCYRT